MRVHTFSHPALNFILNFGPALGKCYHYCAALVTVAGDIAALNMAERVRHCHTNDVVSQCLSGQSFCLDSVTNADDPRLAIGMNAAV